MSKTVFSKIIDRDIPANIIWEDESACAFLDIKPISPGHVLLVPVNPAPDYIFDMASADYCALWERARWLSGHIKAAMGCKRVGVMVEGFMVPHVHIHLIPINDGSDLNPMDAKSMSLEQLKLYYDLMVKQLS